MNDIFLSITLVTICALGYYFSWRSLSQGKILLSLLLLLLCGLALRAYVSTDLYLHDWDERYHALVAKNLVHHPLIPTLYDKPILPYLPTNWTGNHIWLSKPPIPLWLMSLSIYIGGNNEISIRIPSLIASILSIVLTFKIAKALFDYRIAWLAAFLHSIHGMLIELASGRISSDHVETIFIFLVELAIWLALLSTIKTKKHNLYLVLCGLTIGLAFLSKFLPAFVVLPIWLSFALQSKSVSSLRIFAQFCVLTCIALAVSLSWICYTHFAFPAESNELIALLTRPLNSTVQKHGGSAWYYVDCIRMIFGELVYLPLLWLLYSAYKAFRDSCYLPFCLWILIPLIVFSIADTKRETYLLIAAPAIFIVTAIFWFWLLAYSIDKKHRWLYNLVLLLLIALPLRYTIERVKPFQQHNRNTEWAIALRKLHKQNITKGVLFNYDRPIEAMFYTNLIAYETLPQPNIIITLLEQGYAVLINDNEKLPQSIRAIKGVIVRKINSL
ncbi:MAG: hypothetical protein RL660_1743 [Bacteroidota bacterium]|jgi:4-amino-4-deoxy-L-arabinose transferase